MMEDPNNNSEFGIKEDQMEDLIINSNLGNKEDQMEDPNNNSNLGNNSELNVEELLDNLESTWDDFSSALTVSRMVSDSVIKGMVSAISDESNEKLEQINQELRNCRTAQLKDADDELQEKKIEDLSVIKKQLGDLLKFLSDSELGLHIANNEQKGVFERNSEECVKVIFSDLMKLNRMKNEDLISYLKEEIMKMKRDHDSLLQQKTEEVFVLKRELLKERAKNPVQCENLRKKISKIVNNLDEILLQNELNVMNEKEHKNDLLNEKLEKIRVLDQENKKLRDLLNEKIERIKVFEEENQESRDLLNEKIEKIRVLDEENQELKGLIEEKENELEDSKLFCLNLENEFGIQAEIREKVKKTVLKERFEEFELKIKEQISELNLKKVCESCLKNEEEREKLIQSIDSLSKLVKEKEKLVLEKENFASEIEFKFSQLDRNFNSSMQKVKTLMEKTNEQETYLSNTKRDLNAICQELEAALKNEEEREKLAQSIDSLSKLVQEKEKMVQEKEKLVQDKENFASEIEFKFSKLNRNFNSLMQKCKTLMEKTKEQETYMSNTDRDLNAICQELEGVLVKTYKQEEELAGLKQKFENISDDLEKGKFVVKIDGNCVELVNDFTENMLKKIDNVEWSLVNNVDCAVSRISIMKREFEHLTKEAKLLKNQKEWYKNSSEMSKANLRKAETEVDLLGDEVDSLTYLLNKIFRVLKHYSYVFQHYPGVTEVLKLMEKYINAEGTKISWGETESFGLLTPH
ncbi:hypothetical protein LUZ60_009048 [Juncus effusus]|nr:hypothetical protein LUZ60_009048 [Juncus effusus]